MKRLLMIAVILFTCHLIIPMAQAHGPNIPPDPWDWCK